MARSLAARVLPLLLALGGLALIALAVLTAVPATLQAIGLGSRISPGFGLYNALLLIGGVATLAVAQAAHRPAIWEGLSWAHRVWALRITILRLGVIALEVGLLLLVVRAFQLESPAFTHVIAPLAAGGFLVHALTPAAARPMLFLVLGLTGIGLVLGPGDGTALVLIGLGLVALAHLPIPFRWRVALIIAAGATLAALRVTGVEVPWSRAVWPILGSMFMFRLIVYLHDLRHEKEPVAPSHRLSYFFLLPNVVFPLFPVVDWAGYRRAYYETEAHRIYQRGVEWMVRGVVQLVLYRVVYQYLALPAEAVTDAATLGRHVLANLLLYVRVSGQFHLIVGILHLFGFHLPETHRRYFLASSFTEFWRRINIYWKDFMMKVLYYPAYFRWRRVGERTALVLATLLVFVATWALHSYQWFWLLGSFPITGPDLLFWGTLAAALVVNALREQRHGRARTLKAEPLSASLALKTAGTFVAIAILWSLWMSPSVGAWWAMGSAALRGSDARSFAILGLGLAGVGIAIAGALALARVLTPSVDRPRSFAASAAQSGAVAAALVLVGTVPAREAMGPAAAGVVFTLQQPGLNQEDAARLQRGYYEDLMGITRFNSQLWEIYVRRPPQARWPAVWHTPAGRERDDFLRHDLRPSARISYLGKVFTTNRWGMRDRDYDREKPPGTLRLALMGASVEMGWGVADDEVFSAVTESRLNREPVPGLPTTRYELLNFSVAAYQPPQQLMILDRVLEFAPDVLIVAAHAIDATEAANHIAARLASGIAPPFPFLQQVVREVGADSLDRNEAYRALLTRSDEIVAWVYQEIAEQCRRRGIVPMLLWVPTPERAIPADPEPLARLARAAGFHVVDLSDAYKGQDLATLLIRSFDQHPNARGHRLLADQLYEALVAALPRWIGNGSLP